MTTWSFSNLGNFLNINLKIVLCLLWENWCRFGEYFFWLTEYFELLFTKIAKMMKIIIVSTYVVTLSTVYSSCTNKMTQAFMEKMWDIPRDIFILIQLHIFYQISLKYIGTRLLVGSTVQACSSGFSFRITWNSTEWPSFIWNCSFLFLQGLRSTNIK
jgi:hypothetical protein